MSSRVPSGGGEGQHKQELGERIRARVDAGESVWLAERGQSEGQEPTVWWTGIDDWTTDSGIAWKFETRQEAESFIHHRSRPVGSPWARATEHIWLSGELVSTTPPEVAPKQADLGDGRAARVEASDDIAIIREALQFKYDEIAGICEGMKRETAEKYLAPVRSELEALNRLARLASATTKAGQAESDLGVSGADVADEEINVALNHLHDFAGRFQTTLTKADAQVLVEYIQEATEILADCTAFRDMNTLHRHRVFFGGPDMRLHHRRCRLFGDGRVECHEGCSASTTDDLWSSPKSIAPSGSLPDTATQDGSHD